jgi:hypothetical protein
VRDSDIVSGSNSHLHLHASFPTIATRERNLELHPGSSFSASLWLLQQNIRSFFAFLLMYNHFGVVIIVLYKPCSPCSVFTINWSSFRVNAQGIPMEPSASDHWKIRRSQEEVGQASNVVLQQLMESFESWKE